MTICMCVEVKLRLPAQCPICMLVASVSTKLESFCWHADWLLSVCRWGRSPMVGNMVTTWQERMLDCTGLPRNVIAPAETINVAVIDRHYSAGRSFLNLPDVISHVQVGIIFAADMHL